MAQNLKPITGCTTPNRGLNSLSPSWITTCTDSLTGTTNPSVNSILDNIDTKANSKDSVVIGHTCNCDFVCDGVADQAEIIEGLIYAHSNGIRSVTIKSDSVYNLTAPITMTGLGYMDINFNGSTLVPGSSIQAMLITNCTRIQVHKAIFNAGFYEPIRLVTSDSVDIYDNLILTNATNGSNAAIANNGSNACRIYNNRIAGQNLGTTNYGIYSLNGILNEFYGNKIDGYTNFCMVLDGGSLNNIHDNWMSTGFNRVFLINNNSTHFNLHNNYLIFQGATINAPVYVGNSQYGRINGNFIIATGTSNCPAIELSISPLCAITGNNLINFTGTPNSISGSTGATGIAGNTL